jgi:hypothetical protein
MSDTKQLSGEFEQASARLESSIRDACGQSVEWPAKVAAGVYAALDFASTEEAAFRHLAIESPPWGSDQQRRYAEMIDRFAELLGSEAPRHRSVSASRPVLRSVAAMIADPVRSGRLGRLAEMGPELVQLVLQPYLSFAEAKSWAERTSRSLTKPQSTDSSFTDRETDAATM